MCKIGGGESQYMDVLEKVASVDAQGSVSDEF